MKAAGRRPNHVLVPRRLIGPVITLIFLTGLLLLPSVALAQVESGTIVGTVKDTSGAVLPGAAIKITNLETGMTVQVLTSDLGDYSSPPLKPGQYQVTAELHGFKRNVKQIPLNVNQRARVDFELTVGEITEEVIVTAAVPLLNTETSALGYVRTEREIRDLPLNGRNFVLLIHLVPGVNPTGGGPTLGATASNQRGIMGGSVNGARPGNNNFLIDGIQSQDTDQNVLVFLPVIDAIQEFKVQTNAADAQFGRNGGGTVNLILRSGTNAFRGSVFEFLRNSALDAKNFFDSPGKTPPFKLNQFGGTFGGPIVKDRSFFFADYQGTRLRQAQTFITTVPTLRMRHGDFGESPLRIFDPRTTRRDPNDPNRFIRDPFPDNKIPPELINSASRKLVELYPLPNRSGIVNNFLSNPVRESDTDQFDVRIDHRFSDRDNFFGRYTFAHTDVLVPSILPPPAVGVCCDRPGFNASRGQQVVLSYTRTLAPNKFYEYRYGFSRLRISLSPFTQGTNLAEKVGIPGVNVDPRFSGLSTINIAGFNGLGEGDFNPLLKITNNQQHSLFFSYVRSKHSFKFGFDLARRQANLFSPAQPLGVFSFSGQFTQNPAGVAGTGIGLADFLLGAYASANIDIEPFVGHRRWELFWYVHDDIKVTPKLTLNVGLRYEIVTPFTEVANRQANFVPALGDVFPVKSPQIPGRTAQQTDFTNFAPRFGLAYRLTDKTVLRAAYGIFYSFPGVASGRLPSKAPPFAGRLNFTNNVLDITTARLITDGFPAARPDRFPTRNNNFKFWPPEDPDTYLQQWNLTIEREIATSTVFSVAYVGSKGTHLNIFPNINQARPGPGPAAARRPFPNLADADGAHRAANSIYHSLQVSAQRQFFQGFSFLAAWTYSHSIDWSSGDTGGGPQNALLDWRADRGNSDFDVRHRFVLSWIYELPFGRGKKFLANASGWADKLLGGWQLSGIHTFMTGTPFTPMMTGAQNTLGSGVGGQRPNRIGKGTLPKEQRTLNRYFDTTAFVPPPPFTFGNSGRNILFGPGTKLFDVSIFKRFNLGEVHRSIEFRTDIVG